MIFAERHNLPCKDNPNCFEMMGQSELISKTKALPTSLGPNPNENLRKEGFPVGLKASFLLNVELLIYSNHFIQ